MTRIYNNFHYVKSIISHNSEPEVFESHGSKRPRKETNVGSNFYTYILATLQIIMEAADITLWREAVNSEIELILANHGWEIEMDGSLLIFHDELN